MANNNRVEVHVGAKTSELKEGMKDAEKIVSDSSDLKVDGVYGSNTLGALKTYLAKRGKEGEKVLVRVLNIMQGQRYIEICERNPTQEQFFYGWIANRIG